MRQRKGSQSRRTQENRQLHGNRKDFAARWQARHTKTLSGFGGAGVVEVVKDFRGDTFRAVYTLRFARTVYVLHAFQKKSKTGRETPRPDIELIQQRLREAEQMAKRIEP